MKRYIIFLSKLMILACLCSMYALPANVWASRYRVAVMPVRTSGPEELQYIGPCLTEFLASKLSSEKDIEVIEPEVVEDIAGNQKGNDRTALAKLMAAKGADYFVAGWIDAEEGFGKVDLALIETGTGKILLEYGPKRAPVTDLNKLVKAFASRAAYVIAHKKRIRKRAPSPAGSPVQNMEKAGSDIRNHPDLWFKHSVHDTSVKQPENSLPPLTHYLPFPPPREKEISPQIRRSGPATSSAVLLTEQGTKGETAVEKAKKRGWFQRILTPWKGSKKETPVKTSPAKEGPSKAAQHTFPRPEPGKDDSVNQKWEWY